MATQQGVIYCLFEVVSLTKNSVFEAVSLTKNSDIDKSKYSGYGTGFHRNRTFSFGNGVGRNVKIFGVDMSSSAEIDNRKKDILILGKGLTQGLEHIYTKRRKNIFN